MVLSWREVKALRTASSTMSSRSSRPRMPERMGDKEDPELLQVRVAVSERAASPPGR